jgi:hypothetical protein
MTRQHVWQVYPSMNICQINPSWTQRGNYALLCGAQLMALMLSHTNRRYAALARKVERWHTDSAVVHRKRDVPCHESIWVAQPYILTPWSRVLLEKLTGFAAIQEIPRIYGTRNFITVLTSARHLSLSWARYTQSPQPPPTSSRSILILSVHLRLGLPNGLGPSGFPTKTPCTPLPSPIRATCPAHLILLDFTTRTILGKEYPLFTYRPKN